MRVGLIKVTQGILDNPFGNAFEPGKVRVFSGRQFLVQINGRDGLSTFLVDLLFTGKAVIVSKASRSCRLAKQDMLFHRWVKFCLISSRDLHASFSHSTSCSYASPVIYLQRYATSCLSCSNVHSRYKPFRSASRSSSRIAGSTGAKNS
jgi:hypothetical protein